MIGVGLVNNCTEIKSKIKDALTSDNLDLAGEILKQYLDAHPYDGDNYHLLCRYYFALGEYEKAILCGYEGIRRYPTSGVLYQYVAQTYEKMGDYFSSIVFYQRAINIYTKTGINTDEIAAGVKSLWLALEDELSANPSQELLDTIKLLLAWSKNDFGMDDSMFKTFTEVPKGKVWAGIDEQLGVGTYRLQCRDQMPEQSLNTIQTKFEFLKISKEDTKFEVPGEQKEYLLPILSEQGNVLHTFSLEGGMHEVLQGQKEHFNYYRVHGGTTVRSDKTSIYGELVPLGHSTRRKKLVLNIFVDGLSQTILEDMPAIMPNTAEFFSKGLICRQAYSCAEWTYPSLASYHTGMRVSDHMVFHSSIVTKLPEEVTTLAEYFHEQGYHTSKIDGEWRSTVEHGYYRGFDQLIYQNQSAGSKCETIVGEVIDLIEAFDDTDQFVWMCMGDLHDVADGYDLSLAAQTHIPVEMRTVEEAGETSVKQEYSENKIFAYKTLANKIDQLLLGLYSYIEHKFNDDEIIVSLFADHGQGYLLPVGSHFLGKERDQIAFMFRGGTIQSGMTDEVISAADYIPIMCKLAEIELKGDEKIDGVLPSCFGGNGREYALVESLHPGDPYRALFVTDDNYIFFTNDEPVQDDGRFKLGKFRISIETKNGEVIQNESLEEKYTEIIMDKLKYLILCD